MKLLFSQAKKGNQNILEEECDFSLFASSNSYLIRKLYPCQVKVSYQLFDSIMHVDVEIKGHATLICSRTLEDIEYPLDIKDSLDFTSEEDFASEDVYYEESNEIELDAYLYGIIISYLPVNPIKKGAKLPKNGNGYRVLTEEEKAKELKENKSSPFDKLKDLDL